MHLKEYKFLFTLAIIFAAFLLFCVKISFLSDDAFISYRYAKNLVEGNGLVYNPGERVEGYTNFLWVIICSIFLYFNFDPLTGSRIISIIFSLIIITLTFFIPAQFFKINNFTVLLGPALLALNPGFILWAYSGMETIFFTLLITLAVFSTLHFLQKHESKFLIYSSICFSIASLTRPEGVLFFVLNCLFLFILFLTEKKEKVFKNVRTLIVPVLIFSLIYGIYFMWRFSYYGYFFPNTFYAKTGFENQFLRGLYYCFKFYRESLAMGLLLIFPMIYVLKARSDIKIQYMLFILAGYILYVILIGGDNLLVQRFFVPVMPVIFTLIALGVNYFFNNFKIPDNIRYIIAAVIIFSSIFILTDNRAFPMYGVDRTLSHYDNLIKAGIWLKENSYPDESVAVESAGIIPYFSGLRSYDRLGLNDIYISRKGKYGVGERDKSDEEYVLWEKKPDYFVDEFPTLYKKQKPDLMKNGLLYKYYSVEIGRGVIEEKPGIREEGELYFNFYKKEKVGKNQ